MSIIKLDPEFIMQNVGGEAVLVPVGSAGQEFKGIIRLNSTATFIVEHLREGCTREDLVRALEEEYEGTTEQFEASIDKVLSSLREAGAIK